MKGSYDSKKYFISIEIDWACEAWVAQAPIWGNNVIVETLSIRKDIPK